MVGSGPLAVEAVTGAAEVGEGGCGGGGGGGGGWWWVVGGAAVGGAKAAGRDGERSGSGNGTADHSWNLVARLTKAPGFRSLSSTARRTQSASTLPLRMQPFIPARW